MEVRGHGYNERVGESRFVIQMPQPGLTIDEVKESYLQQHRSHGNDLDFLMMSLWLHIAGFYSESMKFALKVRTSVVDAKDFLVTANKDASHAAFIAANERARPLFEQAAFDIEGKVEGSQTMTAYVELLERMRNDPDLMGSCCGDL